MNTAKQNRLVIDDADFKWLAKSQDRDKIKKVCVEGSALTGTGIQYLKGMHIFSLTISSPNFSDKALTFLPLLPELKELKLGQANKVTSTGYKCIAKSHVKHLKLVNTRIPEGALLELSKKPDLIELFLKNESYAKLFNLDPQPLASMRNLEHLEIKGFDFTNEDLHLLSSLKHLHSLRLENLDLDDSNLELLQSLPSLRNVWLTNTKITSQGLAKLERIKTLAFLDISGCCNVPKKLALQFQTKHKVGATSRKFKVLFDGAKFDSVGEKFGKDLEQGKIDYLEQRVGAY